MRSLVLVALVAATFAGCLDDEPPASDLEVPPPGDVEMPYVLGDVVGFGEPTALELPAGGQGIWIEDGLLYHTNGASLHIVDVSDPAGMKLLGAVEDVGARDVDLLRYANMTLVFLAGSGKGMHIVDATDPTTPRLLTTVDLPSAGVHNLAAVPGTPYVYSSGASGPTKAIDVLDVTDPRDPVVHTFPIPATIGGIPVESDGCHDITVRVDLERAFCAGGGGTYTGAGGETFIWDISEGAGGPTAPRWVSMMDDPRIKYHHQAFANAAGDLLIVNDEFIAPNCVRADTPLPGALDPQVPIGAAWIWDISDEGAPVMRSFVQNPALLERMDPQMSNCGSHFGDLLPDQEKFVMGWYQGGTMLVDFADPDDPVIVEVGPVQGSTWDARYHDGHVFHASGDLLATPLRVADGEATA